MGPKETYGNGVTGKDPCSCWLRKDRAAGRKMGQSSKVRIYRSKLSSESRRMKVIGYDPFLSDDIALECGIKKVQVSQIYWALIVVGGPCQYLEIRGFHHGSYTSLTRNERINK